MYISNFRLPLEMIERLDVLLGEYNKGLNDFLSSDTPLTNAIEFLIRKGDSAGYNLVNFDDIHKENKNTKLFFKYSKNWICTDAVNPAGDYSRSLDELGPADFAVLLRCLKISEYENLALLHYNDIGMWDIPSPADGRPIFDIYDGVLKECRSVVLNLKNKSIEALPFPKFFNMGEREDCSFDNIFNRIMNADFAEFTDKLDGSFISMTRKSTSVNTEQILVTSSNTLIPRGNDHLCYVCDYINENADEKFIELCCKYPEMTFMFEMIYPPIDPHLVEYSEDRGGIYLTGARNKETGELSRYAELRDFADKFNLRLTEMFEGMTLDAARKICATESVANREGFVANIDGFQVKIKLDDFCATSRLVNSASFNGVIRAAVDGNFDDMIAKIPSAFRDKINDNYKRIMSYNSRMNEIILDLVDRVPCDCEMRDSIFWINDNVPAAWRGYVISGFKKGVDSLPEWYIGKNVGKKNESLFNEAEFDRAVVTMNDFLEA